VTPTLDPLGVSALIDGSYRRYLRSLLPLRDGRLAAALSEQIATSPLLAKGPLLEVTPPYRTGATPRALIEEGVLARGLLGVDAPQIHLDRPLYLHQEQAIRKAAAGRNIVVATGTGSGKTESFLYPILSALTAEYTGGRLGPGVRALLLYPMNALANDQLKRLRTLLAASPHITFGRYTGETKETPEAALDAFRTLHPHEEPFPNELLSRREMRSNPPHLLLTNYAMLEYLLLRPADLDLFEGDHAGAWRFIALDEAHVYDGAKAAEVAMLLRRLRDRVAPGRRLQCLATSATVGDDEAKVMEFAGRLFDAPFAWNDADTERQDLVRSTRRAHAPGEAWGPMSAGEYTAVLTDEDPEQALLKIAARYGVDSPSAHAALAHERRMRHVQVILNDDGPTPIDQVATALFDEIPDPDGGAATLIERLQALASLVALGSRLRDGEGNPLLSARYHLFTRATDGAFTCFSDQGPHVSLARHEVCEECRAPAFELGACKRCGDAYLVGAFESVGSGFRLRPRRSPKEKVHWVHLGTAPIVVDDDDQTLEAGRELKAEPRFLCTGCGSLSPAPTVACAGSCSNRKLMEVRLLGTLNDRPSGCLNCGARGAGTVRGFESGNDASAAVVATALYQALPEDDAAATADQPGGGRKLLMFSDSRQSAAFFAPYLQTSYGLFQQRRLILDGLTAGHDPHDAFRVDDLIVHTAKAAAAAGHFERRVSRQQRAHVVGPWVVRELVAVDDRQSLEGRGLVRVGLDRPENAILPPALTSGLGLSADEAWDLLGELVRTLRQQGALTMPDGVEADDEVFTPRRGPIFVRKVGAERTRKVISWVPGAGENRRSNYLRRLLERLGADVDPAVVLDRTWDLLKGMRDGWLVETHERTIGAVCQVDHTYLDIAPVGPATAVFQCDTCRRLHPVSVRGVCPTINCPGTLHAFVLPDPAADDDHYRRLYRSLNPVALRAQEHTAQWSGQEAARIQQEFIQGRVNALSCSTTFELGVDVGELQSVLMRNMPPTTANYVQRAGRAGRRTDSAALVVTYAQRRSHDLFRYQEPEKMIAGEVRAPYVPLANERIDRRHAHSVALAAFFRHWFRTTGEDWRTVGDFFLSEDGTEAPVRRVAAFLSPVPAEITAALTRVLPEGVARELDVAGGGWVPVLCRLLEGIREELAADVADFERRRREAFDARKDRLAERFGRTITTIVKRPLLGFLATRNVLPKYGFPVDTVELRTHHSGEPVGRHLELTRDLTSAIYEYAPGSSIIAGGKRWTSAGVYRLPGRELLGNYYRVCDHCGFYEEGRDRLADLCASCSAPAVGAPRKYCVPSFGFVASSKVANAGSTPPLRSWHGSTHVLEVAKDPKEYPWELPGGTVACRAGSRGKLVAISDGPNGSGFLICDRCGWGSSMLSRPPGEHTDPLRDRPCSGSLRRLSLAHDYETDIMEVSFAGVLNIAAASAATRFSLLYALLEGASSELEISRDDIDGAMFRRSMGTTSLVLFDTVPGGAGSAVRIAEAFPDVVRAAAARVGNCDCGLETSCYSCLRNYRNQHVHERLRRDAALDALHLLVGIEPAARAALAPLSP
jgi:ATP-dependent helicase YprA (DUF1998 family)